MAKATKINFCSFCGKPQGEVKKMIAGPASVFICDSCVRVCKTIIDRELGEKKTASNEVDPTKNPFSTSKNRASSKPFSISMSSVRITPKKFFRSPFTIITKGLHRNWESEGARTTPINFLRMNSKASKSRKATPCS